MPPTKAATRNGRRNTWIALAAVIGVASLAAAVFSARGEDERRPPTAEERQQRQRAREEKALAQTEEVRRHLLELLADEITAVGLALDRGDGSRAQAALDAKARIHLDPWGRPYDVSVTLRTSHDDPAGQIPLVIGVTTQGPDGGPSVTAHYWRTLRLSLEDAAKRFARMLPPSVSRLDDIEFVDIREKARKCFGPGQAVAAWWTVGKLKRVKVDQGLSRTDRIWFDLDIRSLHGQRTEWPRLDLPVPGSSYTLRVSTWAYDAGTYPHKRERRQEPPETVRRWRAQEGRPIWGGIVTKEQHFGENDVRVSKDGDLLVSIDAFYQLLPLEQQEQLNARSR